MPYEAELTPAQKLLSDLEAEQRRLLGRVWKIPLQHHSVRGTLAFRLPYEYAETRAGKAILAMVETETPDRICGGHQRPAGRNVLILWFDCFTFPAAMIEKT